MKKVFITLSILIFVFGNLFGQKADALSWLIGTWKIDTGNGQIVEQWKLLNDSTFIGKSLFVKSATDSTLQETLELSYRGGEWTYHSKVVGQNNGQSIGFKITFLGRSEFISENPSHDFPQRIAYRRIKNALFASIEGKRKGRYSKQNFDFVGE